MLDNGSDKAFAGHFYPNQRIVRLEENIGVYPTFWALKDLGGIVAFLHSDLIIDERWWDRRVMTAFEENPNLGLVGFIGSNEIDAAGGRGLGTTSNFLGGTYYSSNPDKYWIGSPAHVHGKRNRGLTKAAVVDGCAMIFRRSVLDQIAQRKDFPPHHFYDRLLSCEVRELGYEVAVLGIGCDHISGQTVNQEPKYGEMAQRWAEVRGIEKGDRHNWDSVLYQEAERQWLEEYRDSKKLVPVTV